MKKVTLKDLENSSVVGGKLAPPIKKDPVNSKSPSEKTATVESYREFSGESELVADPI